MDLNALSKLTSVSERKNEPLPTRGDSGPGFEAAYREDGATKDDTGSSVDNLDSGTNQPETKVAENAAPEGSSNAHKEVGLSETSAQAGQVDGNAVSTPGEQSASSLNGVGSDTGLAETSVAAANEASTNGMQKGTGGIGQIDGVARPIGQSPADMEPAEPEIQSTPAISGAAVETDKNAAAVNAVRSDTLAAEKSVVSDTQANVGLTEDSTQVNLANEIKAKGSAAGGNAERPVATNDLITNQSLGTNAQGTTSMSLVERHLGGHAVRLLPESGQVATATNEVNANGAHQLGSLVHGRVDGTMAQPQSKLADLEKMQALQRQMAIQPNTELLPSGPQADSPQEAGWDTRSAPILSNVAGSTSVAARPELVPGITLQMAQAMRSAGDRSIEIALNPAELGRVRMVLSPSDAGITLSILTERPETLDLMRRNISDLAKSFAELGYADISFSFEQNDHMRGDGFGHSGDANDNIQDEDLVQAAPAIAALPSSHLAIVPDGVDIRL
ncbi:MAG: flagellar hook-length control protein FliK [Pseudomonadota bacterium]